MGGPGRPGPLAVFRRKGKAVDTDYEAGWPQADLAQGFTWYWSHEAGQYRTVEGDQSAQDISDALSHDRATPAEEAAAADYWAMAAEHAVVSAGANLAIADIEFGEEETPHNLAVLQEAEAAHAAALGVLEEVAEWRDEVHHETGVDDFESGIGDYNPITAAAIYDYLYSDEHAAGLTAEELAEYRSGVALDAEQLAEAGYDVERLASDDAAIEAAAAASEGLTPEGAIATEDELLALAEMERLAAEQTSAMESEDAPVTPGEAEWLKAEQLAERGEQLAGQYEQIRALYDELYDEGYYRQHCEGDGAKEDNYCDRMWEYAEQLAAAGATAEEYRLAAEWTEEIERAGEEFDAAVNGQLMENGRDPAIEGAGQEALAKLLYDLDQARCARDDDDTPEEERSTLTQHVEHLEEQAAELAEELSFTPFDRASDEPEDPDPAGWMSASEAIANVPEWVAEQGPAAVADWVAEQCDRESVEGDGDEGKGEEPSAAERAVAAAHEAVEAHLDEQERAPAMASAPAATNTREDVDE